MKPCITYTQQRGHAAILFALMIPLLFGVFILGTDGARALQDKARLEEASEVAALAIAGQSGGSEQARNKLATDYIQYYFPHADVNKIETQVIPCEDNDFCDQGGAASERFFEYQVAAHIKEPNWFSKSSIETSFGDNLNIGGYSSARKYQSKTVDVVLVADFSGSMDKNFQGEDSEPRKYKSLQKVISDVADTIESYNKKVDTKKSTLGFVGFNIYTHPSSNDGLGYNYIICDKSINKNNRYNTDDYFSRYYYYQHNNYHYINWNQRYNIHINGPLNNPSYSEDRSLYDGWCGQLYSAPIRDNSWHTYTKVINNRQYINYKATVKNIFEVSKFKPSLRANYTLNFHDIPLTDDVKSVSDQVYEFTPQGGTAFYTGLIRGAQMANTGENPRRLIILLSDGVNTVDQKNYREDSNNETGDEDSNNETGDTATDKLIKAELCTRILDHLNHQSVGEESVNARMFAIGFGSDYRLEDYNQMKQCVGDNNVYDAKNDSQAIKNKILELIAEEMGRLTPSDEK
ncbi:hypothetical protein ACFODT_06090 [Vibrio zhugei]|uniref:Pilus assembly protein TadG n=1 Tax=Vibrio zhugei TaxID=2479546 RepID=A0ABV7C5W0_9VIBR|nr:pilus assembly protein [Vibrio zhugei]